MQPPQAVLQVLLCSVLFTSSINSDGSGDGGFIIPQKPNPQKKIPIFFSFITDGSESDKLSSLASARLAVTLNLALFDINRNFSGYTLRNTAILDSECDPTTSLDKFFEHFHDKFSPTYISSLCCGCSPATIPVAEISHYWNIPQISFSAAAEELTDRRRFQSFFRTIPSFKYISQAMKALMLEFGWSQMVTIFQDDSTFNMITQGLQESFDLNGWNLEVKSTTSDSMFNWERDYRIVFVSAYIDTTVDILCEAVHRGLYGSDYVWITMAWSVGWWQTSSNSSCSPEMMQKIVNNSLVIIPDGYLLVDPSEQTYSGLTSDDFSQLSELYNFSLGQPIFPPGVVYDAVWALALGLMETAERVNRNDESGCESVPGELVPLEMFDYFNSKMGCVLRSSLANVSFVGITGLVEFNENGSRLNDNHIVLLQHQALDDEAKAVSGEVLGRLTIANIIVDQNGSIFTYTDGENMSTVWPAGVPYDGSPTTEISSHDLVLSIFYIILASAGLIYAAACLAFNFIFRHKLVVKLSSPFINFLIVLGAALLYMTVYFLAIPLTDVAVDTIFCHMEIWFFSVGYTLCFAVILAKTWRVYYIFSNPTARKKKALIKDWVMFVIVGMVVGVEAVILVVGTAVPEIQLISNATQDHDHPHSVNSEGENVDNLVLICASDSLGQTVWIVVSLTYMAILEMVAIFMAFHTRKVRIKAINDSKEIAALVYINSIILIVVAITLLTLRNRHSLFVVCLGLSILVASTIFLSLVFIPMVIRLYRDPNGEKALNSTTTNNTFGSDKAGVMRSLSITKGAKSNMSLFHRPSVAKKLSPPVKEDAEEGTGNIESSKSVQQVNSVHKEAIGGEKKNENDKNDTRNP